MSAYTITIDQLRKIFAQSGADHADLCIAQMESQDGSDATAPLWAELARLMAAHD